MSSPPDASNRSGSQDVPATLPARGERKGASGDSQPRPTPVPAGAESVASLVRRLGTPPPDLAAQLARRFKDACRQRLAEGETIAAINLNDWTIGPHGELLFTGNAPSAEQGTQDLDTLSAEFLQRLSTPRPAIARPAIARPTDAPRSVPFRSRLHADRDHFKSRNRFEQHAAEETRSLALSSIEQARREKLIEQFTASLADRFGEASVAPPELSEEKLRPGKPQPIARDRRFNWNLVLGIASAAVAIALIGTAIRIHQLRAQRPNPRVSRTTTVAQTAAPSVGDPLPPPKTTELGPPPATQSVASPPTDQNRDPDNEVTPLDFTVPSVMDRERVRGGFDVMDDLDDLLASGLSGDPTDIPDPSVDLAIEPPEIPKFETPLGTTEDSRPGAPARASSFAFAENDVTNETLESVLHSDPSDQDAAEVLQPTRPSPDRFVELPPSGDSETETVIAPSAASVERIEFPSPNSITLSDAATDITRDLINQQNGNPIAQLIRTGPATVLRWSDNASRDGLSQKLLQGRLVLSDGQSVYLRPSIESDPYPLSLDPRRWRPSWPLGAPLPADVSRLELELSVPDSIDLAWHTPFDPAHPHHGSAIAILTPTDAETVAIAVKLDINCSRKLSCRMQFGGRLDPSLPWVPLSRESFAAENALWTETHRKLVMQRRMYKQSYSSANQMDRQMMRTRGQRIEADLERAEAILERLTLLGELAVRIEQHVKLHLHALVQWADAPQTLLRTIRRNTASQDTASQETAPDE
ncbi:MAG: hypothetical protein F9B45_19820 [Phycisphaera sp. RhM]|nr:hypothetical protein [Phycisphaera sp. RhM]